MKMQSAFYLWFCLSLLSALPCQAAEFGRLFTTPTQRSNLDYLRQTTKAPINKNEASNNSEETVIPVVPVEPPASVSMQGYVKRSDGQKGTVWVNNSPMQENTKNNDIQIGKLKDSNRVDISLPANNKHLRLKAGQVYDSETNSVVEASVHAKQQAEKKAEEEAEEKLPQDEDAQ